MASFVTNRAKADFARGIINWGSDTVKILLVSTAFDGTRDHDFVGDITTLAELSGTGYASGHGGAGRKTLGYPSPAVAEDDTADKALIKATSFITWTAIDAGTVRGGVIHKPGTSNDSDALFIGFVELTTPRVTNGGDFNFHFANESGGAGTVFEFQHV